MEYKFDKIDQGQIIMIGCEDRNTYAFPCSNAVFYIGYHLINSINIPQNTSLTYSGQGKFQIQEWGDLYLLQIFEIESKTTLRCKYLNSQMFEESVNINSLVLPKNSIQFTNETLVYLIGEIILVNKKESEYILQTSEGDISKKKNLLNSIPKKLGTGIIFNISTKHIWAKIGDDYNISVSLPAFLIMNQIKSLETLIDRQVSVYQINNIEYFKLKKEKVSPSQILKFEEFSNNFIMNNELELKNSYGIPNIVNEDCFNLHSKVGNQGLYENEAEKHQYLNINENSIK